MFLIDYVKNRVVISVSKSENFDNEDFYAHVNFLKFIDIHYDDDLKTWAVPNDRLDEVLMWIIKKEFDYSITKELAEYIQKYSQKYNRETKFFRGKSVDLSVVNSKETLLEFQKQGINWRISKSNYLDADDAGLGKAQPVTSKILTPKGWVILKDLKLGDLVIGSEGKGKSIIGIYPQGYKDVYRVTFSDGSSTECCDEHLWTYISQNDDCRLKKYKTKSLKELIDIGIKTKGGRRKFRIPSLYSPVEFNPQKLPIHPYIIGCLLGDGGLSQNSINFTSKDVEIINKIGKLLPSGYIINKTKSKMLYNIILEFNKLNKYKNWKKNTFKSTLKNLDLMGKLSKDKYIPECYKLSSVEERYQLLQGLFDTDGYVNRDGTFVCFYTISERLKDDVLFVLRTLGYKASFKIKKGSYINKSINKKIECSDCFIITVSGKNKKKLFSLKRKKNRVKKEYKWSDNKRYFESISYIGKKECLCIKIDSLDNLYLTDDLILTHNTTQNIIIFSSLFKNKEIDGVVIVVPNGLSYHWKYEILKFSNVFKEEDIAIINNETKYRCFTKHKNSKIIIIPNHLIADTLLSYNSNYSKLKSAKHVRWKNVISIKKEWAKTSMFILVDESHEIKNSKAIRSRAIMSIKNQFSYRCCLSATPAINRIEDFYNQVSFIDNSIIPMSEGAFILWLATSLGSQYDKYTINSYHEGNVQELLTNLQPYMIRRLKEDVPEMKVKKIMKETFMELSPLQRDIYRTVTEEEIVLLEEEYNEITFKQVLNKLQIIIEAIDNPLLLRRRSYFNNRLKNLVEKYDIEKDSKFQVFSYLVYKYVDYLGGKVVVYGIHPETLNTLCDKFEKYKPLIIHGKVNTSEEARQNIQDRFNESDENKIIFLSALTSSAGINLQKKCNNIIFYELPWDATLTRQALDRTHRINSTKDSVIDFLIYPETIDNIRYMRTMSRINLNDKMNKRISEDELRNLLQGII